MNDDGAILITNGTLIDGSGGSPRAAMSVLVERGRISAVAPAAELGGAAAARVIDASGKWLIPGLIDMHVHVMLSGGEDALFAWLGCGITTIRDVGGAPDFMLPLREAVASGEKTGPRIVTYGPMLDGSPPIFGGGRRGPTLPGAAELTWILEDESDVDRACDDLIARGVDGFKLYAGLRPDLLTAFIRRVDGRVPVTGHLSRTWASEAIEAGINCLEHVHATVYQDVVRPEHRHPREEGNGFIPNYWTWLNTGWAEADLDADYVNRFVDLLVSRRVALSPTTVLITGGMATREALDEPGLKYTPKALAERRRQQQEMMQRMREEAERSGRPMPPVAQGDPEVGARARENELRFLRKVYDAGGILVPSTDTGAAPNQVPGFALHRELALFSEAGIPNAKVIEMATSVAARVLRRDHDYGTISPGKRADLLILGGDPIADIGNTRKVELVIKDGRPYEPQPLLERAVAGA
ncbi:MAG TPA: amidohydrolase family protein [Dehalococcoidia bacterium]|nr:amidohydrolase family protein [Dehalococcoidia bacterium]